MAALARLKDSAILSMCEEVPVMSAIKRIDPGHPAYQAPLHRTTRYPAEHVTLTASFRKRLRSCVPHRKVGPGKVGIGGKRSGK
jgi:hypothetical protein